MENIKTFESLLSNLKQNCVPVEIFDMEHHSYDEFLLKRRKLMAEKIRKYYIPLEFSSKNF
jgi:primosomal protein N''